MMKRAFRSGWRSLSAAFLLVSSAATAAAASWRDATAELGLDGLATAQVKFVDLNGNLRPDVIVIPAGPNYVPPRVFLHTGTGGDGPVYREFHEHGLPPMRAADILVFADLDNNGVLDAILGRYLDPYQDDYQPAPFPDASAWVPGHGDGTFGEPVLIDSATLGTTRSAAIGDINFNGKPDIVFGNWYERYATGYECFPNDVLLQYRDPDGQPGFIRWPLPEESLTTDYREDLGARPTYGVVLARLDGGLPMLLELNYGRRWNRLYRFQERPRVREIVWGDTTPPPPLVPHDPRIRGQHWVHQLKGRDIAAEAGFDGDAIRHGRHPRWPQAHATAVPRSQRSDEPPFRANGNEFDAAIGDIDNDGDFDVFITTIIHAWAGESSDRSRFLVNQLKETGEMKFYSFEHLSVDRVPQLPPPGEPLEPIHTRYNQGDIYAELADLNHNGRLDLILCSSDYPDPPPYEERLRVFFQQEDGRFKDVTAVLGIDHVGAGMPSLADVNGNGALDLVVGQSFNRLTAKQRHDAALASGALTSEDAQDAAAEPRARLFLNGSTEGRRSIVLYLEGDPDQSITRDAFNTIVRLTADLDRDPDTPSVTQSRQLIGPGGHAGKQSQFLVHFGLNLADAAEKIVIEWPCRNGTISTFENVPAGRYRVAPGDPRPRPVE